MKARGRGTFRNSACMRCSELEGGAEPCVFAECCGLKSALLDALIFGTRSRDAFSCIRAIPRCTGQTGTGHRPITPAESHEGAY